MYGNKQLSVCIKRDNALTTTTIDYITFIYKYYRLSRYELINT